MGEAITLYELVRLVTILRSDPSSAISAALEGWDYPISREALILADLYDLTGQANTTRGKWQPHPGHRPWKTDTRDRQRIGNPGNRTRAEVVEILRGLGHNIPV